MKDSIELFRKNCLKISLLIIQENLLMIWLTSRSVQQSNWFINKNESEEASRKENDNKVWINLYPELGGKTLTLKLSNGDNVRITKKKKTFDKGSTQRWKEEVYKFLKFNLPFQWHINNWL